MRKTLLQFLLLGIFIFPSVALAQKKGEDKSRPNKVKIIKWETNYSLGQNLNNLSFSGLQVVPLLWDSAQLGFAQVGMANRKTPAVPNQPMFAFLDQNIQARYDGLKSNTGPQWVWVVKDLRVSERSRPGFEQSFVRLKASVYQANPGDSLYRPLMQFDTVLSRGGLDATGRHAENIADVFDALLFHCSNLQSPSNGATGFSIGQILEAEQLKKRSPILDVNGNYTNGVYRSFTEFLANKPGITEFTVSQANKKTILQENAASRNRQIPDAWGVCKDGKPYKYHNGRLFALERVGDGYILEEYVSMSRKYQNDRSMAAGFGGLVGATMMDAHTQMPLVEAFPYLARRQPEASVIDMETGELVF